jgi:flagellar biosynthesis/type III secretory pathway protein FliH
VVRRERTLFGGAYEDGMEEGRIKGVEEGMEKGLQLAVERPIASGMTEKVRAGAF